MSSDAGKKQIIRRIIRAYDPALVRLYGRIRCLILNQRFLDEIGQYLPDSGLVLDIGCGYGLFALYYATCFPGIRIRALDLNARRIAAARQAARRLELSNVEFEVADACNFVCCDALRGAYVMDLIHHVPQEAVAPLIDRIAGHLEPDSTLIVKDIDTRPRVKMAYTWLMDKLMDCRAPVRYWSAAEVRQLLQSRGFAVHVHSTLGYLPSPHIVYVATSKSSMASPLRLP